MTPEQREFLEKVRVEFINGRYHHYLCDAINEVQHLIRSRPGSRKIQYYFLNYIKSQLGPGVDDLDQWQRLNGLQNRSEYQRAQDRIAWLNWMLEEK